MGYCTDKPLHIWNSLLLLNFVYKSNRAHFLWVSGVINSLGMLGELEMLVNPLPPARDLQAFLVFSQYPAWVITPETHRKCAVSLKHNLVVSLTYACFIPTKGIIKDLYLKANLSKIAFEILVPPERCKIFVFDAKYNTTLSKGFTSLLASDFKLFKQNISTLISKFSWKPGVRNLWC